MENLTLSQKVLSLDIGCGDFKPDGFIGLDKRKLSCVDIVHDAEVIPYPINNETFDIIRVAHLIEHLLPNKIIDIMNEWWRILKPQGKLYITMPLGGSKRFWLDPTHIHAWIPETATYFDSDYPLYQVYQPKAWKILKVEQNIDLEIVMEKR